MKVALFFLLMISVTIACKKENTPTVVLNEKVDAITATEKTKGNFNNGPYGSSAGTAKIYNVGDKLQLALESFSSSNGPNLMVYLSKEKEPVNFVNLGDLKSTSGNQLYDIPTGISATDYKYALIYCKRFSHLFGFAELN